MSPEVKYDVTGVESRGDFVPPKPGLYNATIEEANVRTPDTGHAGKNDIELVLRVQGGDHAGAPLWWYVMLEPEWPWKLRALVDAVGLKDKGALKTEALINKRVKVRVRAGEYQGEYQAKVANIMPTDAGASADAAPEGEEPPDEPDEPDESEVESGLPDDWDEWTDEDVKADLKEKGLKASPNNAKNRRATLAAHYESGEDEPEDDEPDEPEEGENEPVNYDALTDEQLREECTNRGLQSVGPRSRLIGRLKKDDESKEDPFA